MTRCAVPEVFSKRRWCVYLHCIRHLRRGGGGGGGTLHGFRWRARGVSRRGDDV